MDYQAMRNIADSLITEFSNGEPATLLKGEKVKDQQTGAIKKTFGKRWIYIMGNKDLITNNNENKFVEKTLRCCF